VKLRHYLKFHGALTAFGRVIEGIMTSAGHSTAPGRRLHTSDGHRTTFVLNSNRTILLFVLHGFSQQRVRVVLVQIRTPSLVDAALNWMTYG